MVKTFISLAILVMLISNSMVSFSQVMPKTMIYAEKELQRSINGFSTQEIVPYYISYTITDNKSYNLSAKWGKMSRALISETRNLDADVRAGNYKFDNTHIIRGDNDFSLGISSMNDLPLNDDEAGIRSRIWIITDRAYKSALERLEKARSNKAVKVAEEDSSADFTNEKPEIFFDTPQTLVIDTAMWNAKLRKYSAKFANEPLIFDASVTLTASLNHKMFLSSEGAKISHYEKGIRIMISAQTKAEDGMSLPLFDDWFSYDESKLPDDKTIEDAIDKMKAMLLKLREAPMATTYSGPCILSGEASGVFFHEIFGHRVEGHRQKDPNSAQTFKQSLGEKILPDFINVIFDPNLKNLRGQDLHGYYQFDDEGVKAQRVVTVENGEFKGFIMSRNPIDGFKNSNGHGRKAPGNTVVSRQSNLVVEATKTIPLEQLKSELRAEALKQGKEYGLYFEQVSGGFTFTGRNIPNSFNVTPLIVYKIFTDGRPDELVRGVDLIGTPLSTFANVIAAGDNYGIFNGVCGAESGPVPVSASSPSLLVNKIEVQKKHKSQAKLPILNAPSIHEVE